MKKLRWPYILMVIAILAITGFQGYWLKNNYDREKQNLDIRTNFSFRQTILRLQSTKLKLDRFNMRVDSNHTLSVTASSKKGTSSNRQREQAISLVNLIQEKMLDTLKLVDASKIKKISVENTGDSAEKVIRINYGKASYGNNRNDSFEFRSRGGGGFMDDRFSGPPDMDPGRRGFPFSGNNMVFRFLYDVDSLSLKDSVTVKEITEAYGKRLKDDNINVDFQVTRLDSANTVSPNAVTIGFSRPTTFGLSLQNTFSYMLDKLKLPILFSLLLIGITVFSFVLLYRNMIKQQRLSALKNEFISNITHELKTPIATVGVAIEALKNFNAIHDPKRTMEYLDISQNELQRLNLLVDKVLKLSMFEKKEIELKYEVVNLKDIVDEVVSSMKLQIEKYHAQVLLNYEGDCSLQADKLHLLSVVFNLVDNALKYSKGNPLLKINVEEKENSIEMRIADNGIGISPEYHTKVFDKFFRVPHGDTHNAKGYGLGLSYVAHVVAKHKGTIRVESKSNEGTTFTISLPKKNT